MNCAQAGGACAGREGPGGWGLRRFESRIPRNKLVSAISLHSRWLLCPHPLVFSGEEVMGDVMLGLAGNPPCPLAT